MVLLAQERTAESSDGLEAPRRYWAWATIIVGIALSVLDGTIANVALPTIAEDFKADPAMSIWIINGYQLAIVITMLPFASLGEIHGYRRVYLAGVMVFTLASLACCLSGSLEMLTAMRVLQGLGAAGLMSVNTALLRYTVREKALGMAIGVNALVVAASATVGPTLAGFVLSVASWPWLFAINLPLGIAALAMGWRSLPDSDLADRRFDLVSAVLSAAAIGLIVTTIDSIGHQLAWWLVGSQAVGATVAGTLLVRRELGMTDPLVPLDLLDNPMFSMSVGASVVSFAGNTLALVSLPFVLQTGLGFSPMHVGILMMPWPLALAFVAPFAGWMSDRYSPAVLGGIGLGVLSLGLALLVVLPAAPSGLDISWRMALCGAGFGFFQSPNNRILIGSAPKERSGAASGMLGTARLFGQSIGAAVVALLLGLFGLAGATTALAVGAVFAGVAAIISFARLRRFERAGG